MADEVTTEPRPEQFGHPFLTRPAWAAALEDRLGRSLPVGPDVFALVKIAAIAPLLYWALPALEDAGGWRIAAVIGLFTAHLLADWLSGIAARERPNSFNRVLDHAADYPLLVVLAWYGQGHLPAGLLILKLAIDLVLLVLHALGRGEHGNRLRTGLNYATLFAMLLVALGRGGNLFDPEIVGWLLVANVLFNSAAALYNLGVIQKRFIADILSGANLMCGVVSMVFAWRGHYEFSLLFLMLGAAFDGFDGAAARRFGGTSWGVYSDDVADAVNYGIAPGFALFVALPGLEGWIIGPFYTLFTLSRLVYFTLNKSGSDPDYFSGVPSTLGGLITLSALILFQGHPALIGLLVGIAGVLMVGFDTHYRHLGRALGKHKRAFYGMPPLLIILLGGQKLLGPEAPVALILIACLGYGLKPNVEHMIEVVKRYGEQDNSEKAIG